MSTFQCYACDAIVEEGMHACVGCGAKLTKSAFEVYQARRESARVSEQWKLLYAVTAILCFTLGFGSGSLAGRTNKGAEDQHQESPGSKPLRMSIEEVNDAYIRSIENSLSLGIANWVWGTDSAMVVELVPPTPQQPVVLWQTLDHKDREQLMGFLSVAYTRALVAGGIPLDLAKDGHPPLVIQYRGATTPLAVRTQDGVLKVYASPYDQTAPQQRTDQ